MDRETEARETMISWIMTKKLATPEWLTSLIWLVGNEGRKMRKKVKKTQGSVLQPSSVPIDANRWSLVSNEMSVRPLDCKTCMSYYAKVVV